MFRAIESAFRFQTDQAPPIAFRRMASSDSFGTTQHNASIPERLLHVAFYMHNLAGGGAERVSLTLMHHLCERGFIVSLVLHSGGGELRDLVPEGVHVHVLNKTRTAQDLVPLIRFLRRERVDLLLSNLHHDNIMALIAKALARVPTRVVVCQHAVLSEETTPVSSWKYRILPIAYRLLRPMIGGIVAVSDWTADDFGRVCGIERNLITRIYNPVIDEKFGSKLYAGVNHPWFHEPTPVFVSAGRLVKEKDQANLLRGFALHRQRRQARLFLMGTGSELESLRALAHNLGIERDVTFAGFVQNPLPYIRQAHCFVLTSRFEGFGVAIVEALACGTPVISTDCPGGPVEILDGGRYGRLVPVGDPDALASAMNEDLRAKFPPEALRARAEAFSVSASVKEYVDLLSRLRPEAWETIS